MPVNLLTLTGTLLLSLLLGLAMARGLLQMLLPRPQASPAKWNPDKATRPSR